jgi:AraC-like DNA-binding protein/DNA gyrase inhibitor GyrI
MHYRMRSVLTALVYVETHFNERLVLAKIAEIARLSPYYLHRLLHAYLSMPLGKYIRYLRFTGSLKRLKYSRFSISEIAFAMGYEDGSSFTRAFLKQAGKSPRDYRRSIQKQFCQFQKMDLPRKNYPFVEEPQYVYRNEEKVFFLRKEGDYQETVFEGVKEWQKKLSSRGMLKEVNKCYGMALDDPLMISRTECRFDLCVSLLCMMSKSPWGQKSLCGGKYAVFTYHGLFCELEKVFTQLHYFWSLKYREKLRFTGSFCEYDGVILQEEISSYNTIITAKYYIPLIG